MAMDVVKGLSDSGIKTEIIHLADLRIGFCRHCEACHKKMLHCSIKDSVPELIKKMLSADAVIFASPNYINQVTASMKALFDRAAHFIHCKRLLGKYIAAVVTSGSGNDEDVLQYIKYFGHTCGAQYSGGVSCSAYALKAKIQEAYQLGVKLAEDVKEKRVFIGQVTVIEKGREHFKRIMQFRKDDWQAEYAYWQDKGWL